MKILYTKLKSKKIMENLSINYKQIFTDILETQSLEKREKCLPILEKKNFSAIDVIALNQKIFVTNNEYNEQLNQKYRSYSKSDILKILNYQKVNRLNNTQLANHFKLSRNTIARWKKML